jgi:hypothetical protein
MAMRVFRGFEAIAGCKAGLLAQLAANPKAGGAGDPILNVANELTVHCIFMCE